jgi:hypothetical protein
MGSRPGDVDTYVGGVRVDILSDKAGRQTPEPVVTVAMTVRLPADLYWRVATAAKGDDRTISQVVRLALRWYLDQ